MRGANLSWANLQETLFDGAQMTNTNLYNAKT
ncbi:MAG: pentapeptide repeat-containing protein [Pseudanabaena sp.]